MGEGEVKREREIVVGVVVDLLGHNVEGGIYRKIRQDPELIHVP